MLTETLTRIELADPMAPVPYRIRRVTKETYDTFTFELEPVNGRVMSFAPGQFNMLYVFGVGEVPISISGDPAEPDALVQTVRAVGPTTRAMSKLRRDDVIGVRGPFGTRWPTDEARGKDVVVVVGGIGLAPLRPMIYQLLADRDSFNRVYLLYGARTPDDLLYTRELSDWRGRLDFDVEVTVDSAPADWRGHVGVVTTLIPRAEFDPQNTIAAVCGPEIMMRFTIMELQKRGMSDENIYVSMERNMKCGIGLCGHCQYGPTFICKDGAVFPYERIRELFRKREI
jgi:NAD(P)H-flavin reductase